MATIAPTYDRDNAGRVTTVTWSGMATGDTINSANIKSMNKPALVATLHIYGTFGGATLTITGSNTDSNFVAMNDNQGTAISSTAAAIWELSSGALYLKPTISGGTSDSVTMVLAVWWA